MSQRDSLTSLAETFRFDDDELMVIGQMAAQLAHLTRDDVIGVIMKTTTLLRDPQGERVVAMARKLELLAQLHDAGQP